MEQIADLLQNLRTMHLPWLILHPLVTISLLALLAYVAWITGYDYDMEAVGRFNTGLLIFGIFISLCEYAANFGIEKITYNLECEGECSSFHFLVNTF